MNLELRWVIAVSIVLITVQPVLAEKPNIILIFSDDHGYSDLGSQAIKADLKTPYLDRLAEGGVRFTNGYVSAPQCVPSRAGLLAGRYQNRFGVEANKYPLDGFGEAQTIAERLKSAGYVTGMTGKWHLGPAPEITRHGFDWVYYKNAGRPGWSNYDLKGRPKDPGPERSKLYHLDANSQAACAFIKRHHDKPFFFYCAYRAPHVPLDAPEKYLGRFKKDMPKRRRQALAMIAAMDDGVGQMMATLRAHGLEEKTLIFFIGDNGAPLKIHKIDAPGGGPGWDGSLNDPLNGEKGMLSEGGIRVPFLAYWKGKLRSGTVCDDPVISLDVAATANSLAGLPDDPKLDGINLVPALSNSKQSIEKRTLYWRWLSQSAIREGKWKFLKGGKYEYLFDLSSDPEEKKNLISQHPQVAQLLKKKLETWAQELNPPGIKLQNQAQTWNRYFEHYLEGNPEPRPNKPTTTQPASSIKGWICRGGTLKIENGMLTVNSLNSAKRNPFIVKNQLALAANSKLEIRLKSKQSGKVGVSWRETGQKDFSAEQVAWNSKKAGRAFDTFQMEMNSANKIIHIRILLPAPNTEIESIKVLNSNDQVTQKWNFDK